MSSICMSDHIEEVNHCEIQTRRNSQQRSQRATKILSDLKLDEEPDENSISEVEFDPEDKSKFYLSNLFGYKCINVKNTGGIFEVFEPAKKNFVSRKPYIKSYDEKSGSVFTDFEDSNEDNEEKRDRLVRLKFGRNSLEKGLASKDKYMSYKGESSKAIQRLDKSVIESDSGFIKHASTVDPEKQSLQILTKKPRTKDKTPSSNISNYDSMNSPTIKLSKYRWARNGSSRKVSFDEQPPSRFMKYEDSSSSGSESQEDTTRQMQTLARLSVRRESSIPSKVLNNMKYFYRLKRSPILKGTLLGKMLNVNKRDFTHIKYIDHDKLMNQMNNSSLPTRTSKHGQLSKQEFNKMINAGYKSSESNWSTPEPESEHESDPEKIEESPEVPPNFKKVAENSIYQGITKIFFKPLDTMLHEGKEKKVRNEAVRNSGDHHLMIPLKKIEYNRMDSNASSNDWTRSAYDKPVSNLVNKDTIERKNTPNIDNTTKLVVNKEVMIKKQSTNKIESKAHSISPDSSKIKKISFMRSATKAIKTRDKNSKHKKRKINKQLEQKEQDYKNTIMVLITGGEIDKLSDLLQKI